MNQQCNSRAVILVIDDEASVLGEVAAAVTPSGYTCHGCASADAAMEMARQLSPDLIICDINLDGQSGLELCERIKADPDMAQVPVMFLSGAQVPDIIRRSHAAGGVYYLRKPFDPEVLVELMEKALWMPHLIESKLAQKRRATWAI